MRVDLHELTNEPLRVRGDRLPDWARKCDDALLNILDGLPVRPTLERLLARQHFVQHNARRPHVNQRSVFDAAAYVNAYVRRDADHGGQDIVVDALLGDKICVSKVSESNGHRELGGGAEDVFWPDVAVDDILAVDVVECSDELPHYDTSVGLGQTLVLRQQVGQGAAAHEFEDEMVLLDGGKHIDGLDDGRMVEDGVDVALASDPFQSLDVVASLLDNLDGEDVGGVVQVVGIIDSGIRALGDEGTESVVALETPLAGE